MPRASSNTPAPKPAEPARAGAPAKPSSPFHRVATTTEWLDVHRLGDHLFVQGGSLLAEVKDGRVDVDESYGRGLGANVESLFGHWPDGAWANVVLSNGRVGWGGLRHWNGRRWTVVGRDLSQTWVYADVQPWKDHTLLALEFSYFMKRPAVRFKLVGKRRSGPIPLLARACHGRTRVLSPAFIAFETGQVFIAGSDCKSDKLTAEWWDAGERHGHLHHFDVEGDQNSTFLIAKNPHSIWLVTSAGIAHFDGQNWQLLPNVGSVVPRSVALAPDGTLWAVCDTSTAKALATEVYERAPGARWKPVPLPGGDTHARSVATMPNGAIWVAARDGLFSTLAPKSGVQEIHGGYFQQFPSAVRAPAPATSSCPSIYVLLYTLAKEAPKNYDFPLTRAALTGHTEFQSARFAETESHGRRYFGAFVKNLALGKKMAKLVREKVKDSTPVVLCAKPKVVHEVRFDLKTGKLRH